MSSAPEHAFQTAMRWLAGGVWLVVILALGTYAVTRPELWPRVFGVVALVVGISVGLLVTRVSRVGLTVLPLAVFSLGGVLAASHMSNAHGYNGGDWSVAAVVVVGGIVDGMIATIAVGVTALARAAWRGEAPQLL